MLSIPGISMNQSSVGETEEAALLPMKEVLAKLLILLQKWDEYVDKEKSYLLLAAKAAYTMYSGGDANADDLSHQVKYTTAITKAMDETLISKEKPEKVLSDAELYEEKEDYESSFIHLLKYRRFCRVRGDVSEDAGTANVFHKMGLVHQKKGLYSNALKFYELEFGFRHNLHIDDDLALAECHMGIGCVYDDTNKFPEALKNYNKALKIRVKMLGPDHPDVASTYNDIAVVYKNQGKFVEALQNYDRSLQIKLEKLGADHPSVANTYNNMANVYKKEHKYEKALEYFNFDLQISREKLGADHPDVASTYANIASLYKKQRLYSDAVLYYEECLKIRILKLGEGHPKTKAAKEQLMLCKLFLPQNFSLPSFSSFFSCLNSSATEDEEHDDSQTPSSPPPLFASPIVTLPSPKNRPKVEIRRMEDTFEKESGNPGKAEKWQKRKFVCEGDTIIYYKWAFVKCGEIQLQKATLVKNPPPNNLYIDDNSGRVYKMRTDDSNTLSYWKKVLGDALI